MAGAAGEPGASGGPQVLKEHGAPSRDSIRRFQREARAASRLRHPNTIRIYDYGATDDGVLYIAMELLDGMDLESLVELTGPLPARRAIYLVRQACGSLAEAHGLGIIHRDIKPANLFAATLGEEHDVLKLLHFGVVRMEQPTETMPNITESGVFAGTPAYMAPEVGDGTDVDARSDLYGLGAVLYFVVTGTVLFPHKTFSETLILHATQMPDAPSKRLGQPIPEDLERVILRCLAKDPRDRYRSATDLEAALVACKDAGAWSSRDAREFWTTFRSSMRVRAARV